MLEITAKSQGKNKLLFLNPADMKTSKDDFAA